MTRPTESQNQALEGFRAYLQMLAQVQMDPQLQGKLDLSGAVQQTLLEAYQSWEQIADWGREQQAGWLRRALANNLTDEIRKLRTQSRDVYREQSVEAALDQSSANLAAWLKAEESSPSEKVQREEQALRVAEALAKLPEPERQAIILQRWHGRTLKQIGQHLGRTANAVAGLLHRGMQKLREDLRDLE